MVERSLFQKGQDMFDQTPPDEASPRSRAVKLGEQVILGKSREILKHAVGCGCNTCRGVFDNELDEMNYPEEVFPEVKDTMWVKMGGSLPKKPVKFDELE